MDVDGDITCWMTEAQMDLGRARFEGGKVGGSLGWGHQAGELHSPHRETGQGLYEFPQPAAQGIGPF